MNNGDKYSGVLSEQHFDIFFVLVWQAL